MNEVDDLTQTDCCRTSVDRYMCERTGGGRGGNFGLSTVLCIVVNNSVWSML